MTLIGRIAAAGAAALLAWPAAPRADGGGDELALFALDAQLQRETAVASHRARSVRESPGIVTVLTREEMVSAGARHLADALALVPGFQLGGDVESTTGVGFRGMWGGEGKVLLLVDGVEMNEPLYGSVALEAVPLEQVETVEVIRGPGSALYGGFAELAVVNVTTRGARALERGAAAASYGQMGGGLGRRALTLGLGWSGAGASASAQVTAGQAQRSDRPYVDGAGQSYAMASASAADPLFVDLGAQVGGLQLRALHSDLRTQTRDGYGDVLPSAVGVRFRTTAADARWDLPVGERVVVTPRLSWTRSTPWQSTAAEPVTFYDKTADRLRGRVTATWRGDGLELVAGAEGHVERAVENRPSSPLSVPFDTGHVLTVENAAAFGEADWETPIANVLAGARYEHHSRFGDSFVPRIAATKLLAPFHLKLLYSRAFKAPLVENVTSNPDIAPERTRALEAELGWQASEHVYAAVSAFDTRVDDAIVYTADSSGNLAGLDVYRNYARTGTRGVEVDLRLLTSRLSGAVTYSFYDARAYNDVDLYAVPGHPALLLGFAGHKVTARATARLPRSVDVTATAVWLSDRYGALASDPQGEPVIGRVPANLDLGVAVTWRDAWVRGLDVCAAVHDLLDAGSLYVVPYRPAATTHPPTPGASREVMVRVAWSGGR